jgi:hypothetical protein
MSKKELCYLLLQSAESSGNIICYPRHPLPFEEKDSPDKNSVWSVGGFDGHNIILRRRFVPRLTDMDDLYPICDSFVLESKFHTLKLKNWNITLSINVLSVLKHNPQLLEVLDNSYKDLIHNELLKLDPHSRILSMVSGYVASSHAIQNLFKASLSKELVVHLGHVYATNPFGVPELRSLIMEYVGGVEDHEAYTEYKNFYSAKAMSSPKIFYHSHSRSHMSDDECDCIEWNADTDPPDAVDYAIALLEENPLRDPFDCLLPEEIDVIENADIEEALEETGNADA